VVFRDCKPGQKSYGFERERWVCGFEREREMGLWVRERKRGREIRWVWAAMGDGEENFAEKLDLIVCG
jgi:hypothetical protein